MNHTKKPEPQKDVETLPNISATSEKQNVVLYGELGNGPIVEVFILNETMWMTQRQMAEVFNVDRSVIGKHLKNVFESGELTQDMVCAKFAHTASDGRIYETMFYSLDAIISVGYRVNSTQATRFRIWATQVLKEYIIKGFALDDERLKQSKKLFGQDYFRELLQRVRSIRASEAQIWRQESKICFTSPSLARLPQKLSTLMQTIKNRTWVSLRGIRHQMDGFLSPMLLLRKTI